VDQGSFTPGEGDSRGNIEERPRPCQPSGEALGSGPRSGGAEVRARRVAGAVILTAEHAHISVPGGAVSSDVETLASQIVEGSTRALARGLTWVESGGARAEALCARPVLG